MHLKEVRDPKTGRTMIVNDGVVDDPFEMFGHGIMSYFKMMKYMIYIFLVLTIINLPSMYIYWTANDTVIPSTAGYQQQLFGHIIKMSLGNMRQKQSTCVHQFYGIDHS